MSISRFGVGVSLLVYLGLLFAEYLRPGFVVNAMNAHVLWVVMVGWLVGETVNCCARLRRLNGNSDSEITALTEAQPINRFNRLSFLLIGLLLALIVWHLGSLFGDMRLFFALAVGILPLFLLK